MAFKTGDLVKLNKEGLQRIYGNKNIPINEYNKTCRVLWVEENEQTTKKEIHVDDEKINQFDLDTTCFTKI